MEKKKRLTREMKTVAVYVTNKINYLETFKLFTFFYMQDYEACKDYRSCTYIWLYIVLIFLF